MAVVTMTDGDVYEIYTVSFVEAFCKGAGIYSLGADHPVAYLPLLVGPVALEIPFDQVERMDLNLDATVQVDQGVAQGTTVTLVNGQELQGFLVYLTYGGESRPARAIYGRTAITGGSEDFESEISKIASVTFMVAGEGKVSATVSETNGTVTEGVSNFGFIIEAGTNRTGVDKLQNVAIRVGDITSEVPVTDIRMIQREEHHFVITLQDGEKLEGNIPSGINLLGTTRMSGRPAGFRGSFRDIQSVVFQ